MSNFTLKELQKKAPWYNTYGKPFQKMPLKHRDFQHGHMHVMKALGKLAAFIDDGDHAVGKYFPKKEVAKYVADLVVCAVRMANVNPTGRINLAEAVLLRIKEKTGVQVKK